MDFSPDSLNDRLIAAEKEFHDWPVEPTAAEAALKQQVACMVAMGALGYRFMLCRGLVWRAAPLPADIRKGKPRKCYQNAALLAMHHPEKYIYVEGIAHGIIATEHAWCVTTDGQVVDPTWKSPENCAYLGIPIAPEFLRRCTLESGYWGIFTGQQSPEFYAAPVSSMVHARWAADIEKRPVPLALQSAFQSILRRVARDSAQA